MEVSNEIKAKVFAQYLGQECKAGESDLVRGSLVSIRDFDLNPPEVEIVNKKASACFKDNLDRCTLILRPLSVITDEDAIEVARIMNWEPNDIEIKLIKHGIGVGFKDGSWNIDIKSYAFIIQYLQSKGYDLPHYLLGGKTLFEAGLAIYE